MRDQRKQSERASDDVAQWTGRSSGHRLLPTIHHLFQITCTVFFSHNSVTLLAQLTKRPQPLRAHRYPWVPACSPPENPATMVLSLPNSLIGNRNTYLKAPSAPQSPQRIHAKRYFPNIKEAVQRRGPHLLLVAEVMLQQHRIAESFTRR